MKKLLARFVRQSPAMIVAMLALFAAMGGTAIAASSALITGKQIKNSSITGADVKNKSLTQKDFRGSVRGPRGLRGPAGPQGPQGPQGAVGPAGAPNPNAVDSQNLGGFPASSYVMNGGLTLLTTGTSEWQPGANPPAGLDIDRYTGVLYATSAGASQVYFNVSPTVPASLYGKAVQWEGVELCYDASATAVLLDVFLGVHRDSAGPNDNTYFVQQHDGTDRTDRACRVYNLTTPHVLTTEDWAQIAIQVGYTAAGQLFQIGRTTFIFRPTAAAAAAPTSVATTLKPVASPSAAGSHP